LKNGIILKKSESQVKYRVFNFKSDEVKSEIEKIKGIVGKNLRTEFGNNFKPISSQTFKMGMNENLIAKLNTKDFDQSFECSF